MNITIQWLENPAGILRIHSDDDGFGDNYIWCCTVERRGDTAMLHGAMTAPPVYCIDAIEAELRKQGFRVARWIRQSGKRVEVKL